jgi:uncharacterized membrane protein YcaP (DUF421 family)
MVGPDNSLLGGILAAATLFAANSLLENLIFKSKKVSRFIQGDAIMLIYKGAVIAKHLKLARMSREELEAAIREHGVSDISDVDVAILETDGNISVLSDNYHKKTTHHRKTHKVVEKEIM